MAVTLHWFGHASFRISGSKTVFIDPWKLPPDAGKADVVIVSHSHYDHCSPEDVALVSTDATTVLASADCKGKLAGGMTTVAPGQTRELDGVTVELVPAYNVGKDFHPRANDWLGAIVQLDGQRIYYAGDTDEIPEMGQLDDIGVALLPVGGTYTLNAAQAANATKAIKPALAIPYHWGDIVGEHSDADAFKAQAACKVKVLSPGGELGL